MKIIRHIPSTVLNKPCALSIGNFDGVHLGHQSIIHQLTKTAKERDLISVLMSFEPHPYEFFQKQTKERIMGLREKTTELDHLGVNVLNILRFNQRLAQTSPDDFIKNYLIDGLNINYLIVGDDFRFGLKRAGDYELLEKASKQYGFDLCRAPRLEIDEERVSSTRIRAHLKQAQFDEVQRLLGRPYYILGKVKKGMARGREIGFPTANIGLQKQRTIANGVFAVKASVCGSDSQVKINGVANLGRRPTVGGDEILLEVHLFDVKPDLYGQYLKVDFIKKIREEKKFDSFDQLAAQIQKDAQVAREILNQNKPGTYA